MPQRHQRLLEAPYRFSVGRACGGLGTGLSTIREGFFPHLAPEGMVRQVFHLLIQAVRIQPFDRRDDPRVEGTPTLLEQASIGDLLREGVLEGVFEIRK